MQLMPVGRGTCGVLALLLLAGLLGACSGGGEPGRIKIGFLVKQPEVVWFQKEWEFAQQAADRYGFDLIKIGATDAEKVLAAIGNLGAQGAQGFIICTPDVRLGPGIMARANLYGMKVFTVDDQLVGPDGQFLDVPYMGISASDIGRKVGHALYGEYDRRGWPVEETAACIVTYDQLTTAKERTDGAIAALVEAGFPADRIHQTAQRTTDIEGSFNAAGTLLTRFPDVKRWLVASMNDEGVIGAVRAMEGRGFSADTVIGIGIGGSSCVVEFQKSSPTGFYATCLISPKRHGYETAEWMYKWVTEGVEPPEDTRTEGIIITRDTYEQVMREHGLL